MLPGSIIRVPRASLTVSGGLCAWLACLVLKPLPGTSRGPSSPHRHTMTDHTPWGSRTEDTWPALCLRTPGSLSDLDAPSPGPHPLTHLPHSYPRGPSRCCQPDALARLAFWKNSHSRWGGPGLCSHQGCLAGAVCASLLHPHVLGSPSQLFFPGGPPAATRLPQGARFLSVVLLASLRLT